MCRQNAETRRPAWICPASLTWILSNLSNRPLLLASTSCPSEHSPWVSSQITPVRCSGRLWTGIGSYTVAQPFDGGLEDLSRVNPSQHQIITAVQRLMPTPVLGCCFWSATPFLCCSHLSILTLYLVTPSVSPIFIKFHASSFPGRNLSVFFIVHFYNIA